MTLSNEQTLQYINTPQNDNIGDYRDEHNRFDLYFNGGDVASEIEKIDNYENDKQKKLRQKIARSPKDVVHRLVKPFHKVFSAAGGSQVLDMRVTSQKEEFKKHLRELPEGISLDKWMEDYWMEAYITDPNGIILIEAENEGEHRAYPTYKSINIIHDYQLEWDKFKYLILEHGDIEIEVEQGVKEIVKVYRVIDDVQDGLYYVRSGKGQGLEDNIESLVPIGTKIEHNKGFVPAILVSDIIDKKTGGKKSFINKIDEILKEYLRESSVLSIYKFLHAYPKYWYYARKCVKCSGTGKIPDPADETKKITCTSCDGVKLHVNADVSDGVALPLPQGDDPVIAPNISGFSVPPIDVLDKMQASLDSLEKKMEFAIIGTHIEQDKSNTATGRFIDVQPMDTALHSFSETEEVIKQQAADYMARWQYGSKYGKVTIKNGKRFVFEHPDTLWAKYVDARDRKSPITTLDYLYKEYLRSEYQNDSVMFEQKMKEFYIEPMVHFSIEQLNSLAIDTSKIVQDKLFYCDWISQTEDFSGTAEELKMKFNEYLKQQIYETITRVESTSVAGGNGEGGNTEGEADM